MRWDRISRQLRHGAIAAALLLTACIEDSGLDRDATYSASDPNAAGDALLLVGMRLVRPPTQHNWLFGGTDEIPAWFEMFFRGVDARNRFTRVQRRVQVCNALASGFGNAIAGCDPLQPQYRLIRMRAGHYVLSEFRVHQYKLNLSTDFTGSVHPIYIFSKPPPEPPPSLIAFDLAPGRITYIGDFNWDPQHFPAHFAMSRNDRAAEAELYAHPQISAPVVFEPVMHVPMDAYPR